jgi:hypothetical protein
LAKTLLLSISAIHGLKTERLGEGGTQTSGDSIIPEFTKHCNREMIADSLQTHKVRGVPQSSAFRTRQTLCVSSYRVCLAKVSTNADSLLMVSPESNFPR